jgi:hypothetical protein
MIDLRLLSALDIPLLQANHHVQCCLYGTCDQPDERHYVQSPGWALEMPETALVLETLFHDYVSATGDARLRYLMSW